ncbi:MAG: hypothetical protein KKC18_06855 [Chloroflexi bacterium]|nr:hypothetical protein [Chloroflexota bacterium]
MPDWKDVSVPKGSSNRAWHCQVTTAAGGVLFLAIGWRETSTANTAEPEGWVGQAHFQITGYRGQIDIIEFIDLKTREREVAQKRIELTAVKRLAPILRGN